MKLSKAYARQVFLNCPFDDQYRPLYEAIIFTLTAAEYAVRCSRERDDSGETRIGKIVEIIRQSKFSIHDISRVELDPMNQLPRFNMPLELGLFLGARFLADDKKQREKRCLILDAQPYRYQKFISDIAGQDIRSHDGDPEKAIGEVRSWLSTVSGRQLPGKAELVKLYREFRGDLPVFLGGIGLTEAEMQFPDYIHSCLAWLKDRAQPAQGAIAPLSD